MTKYWTNNLVNWSHWLYFPAFSVTTEENLYDWPQPELPRGVSTKVRREWNTFLEPTYFPGQRRVSLKNKYLHKRSGTLKRQFSVIGMPNFSTCEFGRMRPFIHEVRVFLNGPNLSHFCLFLFFSHDKYSSNLTIN